jgi:hypothetical protein
MLVGTTMIASACGPGSCATPSDSGPPFCKPVKEAFEELFENQGNNEAYTSAARVAARNLREAEKSAPPELAEAIGRVAHFYEKTAENGQPLDVSDIQWARPYVGTLGLAVEDQCGFTLEAVSRSAGTRGVPSARR